VPVATRINNVRFKKILRPGATVEIIVDLTERLSDVFFLTGKIIHEGKTAARLDFACKVTAIET
jgi:3-hydroxyacyl-[acyl-carrier-protein] dehydratase